MFPAREQKPGCGPSLAPQGVVRGSKKGSRMVLIFVCLSAMIGVFATFTTGWGPKMFAHDPGPLSGRSCWVTTPSGGIWWGWADPPPPPSQRIPRVSVHSFLLRPSSPVCMFHAVPCPPALCVAHIFIWRAQFGIEGELGGGHGTRICRMELDHSTPFILAQKIPD